MLPNIEDIEEEDVTASLPLPSRSEQEGWADRRQQEESSNREEKRESKVLSQEEKEYEEKWEMEMKLQVEGIAQEDQRTNSWAARAARLSMQPQMVMRRDGSVESL